MDFNVISNLREVHVCCDGLEDFNTEPSILIISNFTCILLKKDSPLKEVFVFEMLTTIHIMIVVPLFHSNFFPEVHFGGNLT